MSYKSYLVTGGLGFLGSALVRSLVRAGHRVRVLDNEFRGARSRVYDIARELELVQADVRDTEAVQRAAKGIDRLCHFAFINGTEFFYSNPNLVLDVGIRGILNVVDACIKCEVGELILASSSEVYQTPPVIPTDETVPLSIPDPHNPRYSYAAAKIISEVIVLNYGQSHFERVVVVRPHNVYGPNMGWEHVIPQFVLRMRELCRQYDLDPVPFPIQGSGIETRAFTYVDDFTEGLTLVIEKGEHLGIYHVGTAEEIAIADVARAVGRYFGRQVEIVPGEIRPGSTPRRCPDISRLVQLGYRPRVPFSEGLPLVTRWYDENAHLQPRRTSLEVAQ